MNKSGKILAASALAVTLLLAALFVCTCQDDCKEENENFEGTYRVSDNLNIYIEEERNQRGNYGMYDAYGRKVMRGIYRAHGRSFLTMYDEKGKRKGLLFSSEGSCFFAGEGNRVFRIVKISDVPVR